MKIKITITSINNKQSTIYLHLPCQKNNSDLSFGFIDFSTSVMNEQLTTHWGSYHTGDHTRIRSVTVLNTQIDDYISSLTDVLKEIKEYNLSKPEDRIIFIEV